MRTHLIASIAVFAAACDQTADPDDVRARINRTLPEIVDQSARASDGAEPALGALGQGFTALDLLAPGILPSFESNASSLKRFVSAPAIGDDGETGDDVARALNEQLFTDANYQGDGVFVIPTALLCSTDELTGTSDPACVDAASQAQLRIRAELAGDDGLDFTLLVGAGPAEPIMLGLRPRSVTVTLDLGELADAAHSLAPAIGEPGLQFELDGMVSARLEVLGEAHAAITITIDQPIHIAVGNGAVDGPEAIRIDSAEAHPLVRIELDAAAQAGSAQLGLGSTQIHLTDDVEPALDIDLPGIAATAALVAGQPLEISGISLGDRTTTASVGGQRAISVDLNRDRGRSLDLTVAGDELDATLTVSPAFDLRIAIDHAALGDTAPRFDVTRVALDGSSAPALRATTSPETGASQLQVAAGQLAIETNPAAYGAIIAAGQCVVEDWRTDAAGEYSVLVAASCQ